MNTTKLNNMPKVTIVQVIYNSKRFIEPVFNAIFNQTFKDFNVVAVISGNDDGGKELLQQKFPEVEVIDPGFNIGFAKGHNLVFSAKGAAPASGRGSAFGGESDFFQLVNPDMIMEPNYIEEMLKIFEDEKVGAATGKLFKVDSSVIEMGTISLRDGAHLLDTTGVVISKSGRARDRGQHEVDTGQYDKDINIQAVSAAGAMYRRSALQATCLHLPSARVDGGQASYQFDRLMAGKLQAKTEYFDEDFHSYWEDVDLTWRMSNAGWKCKFVPSAKGYHSRGASSSANGYKDVVGFIKHHKSLSLRVRQLNYQNHIFMYIKNSRTFYPQFFVREFFMFFYILFFEISTLKIVPNIFKLFSKIWEKRIIIKKMARDAGARPLH